MAVVKNTPERMRLIAAIRAGEDIPLAVNERRESTVWIGSKADLIGCNICVESQFPVSPKRKVWAGFEEADADRATGRFRGVWDWSCAAITGGYFQYKYIERNVRAMLQSALSGASIS